MNGVESLEEQKTQIFIISPFLDIEANNSILVFLNKEYRCATSNFATYVASLSYESQAVCGHISVVGGILGWNIYAGHMVDYSVLMDILMSWFLSPIIAAVTGFILFHIMRKDPYTRIALINSGAFRAYSLGANNIGRLKI
jgi:phosphate/sulfate permease